MKTVQRQKFDPERARQRAQTGQSMANFGAIIEAFTARGIPAEEIRPRENVFTYQVWRQMGRQVRKGEKGVRITTFIPTVRIDHVGGESREVVTGRRPWFATVFHESQTDPIQSEAAPAMDHAALCKGLTSDRSFILPNVPPPAPQPTPRPRPAWIDKLKARRQLLAAS
ncbi:MAG: hypothetical protein IT581_20150 [Verrucomicrobiales bacterium]|nr:hypothetical protein [Verrucomicrobiales bacterium]